MQLRSGTILGQSTKKSQEIHDTNYTIAPLERAKMIVRMRVQERQRKIADRHSEKAVDQILGVLSLFIKDFNEIDAESGHDPQMEKIRNVTAMFGYVNQVSTYTMMNTRFMRLRRTMLKQCENFTKEAEGVIKRRIKVAQEKMTDRPPQDYYNYYMAHYNAMKTELDQFSKTYKNRL
jgi:hypothetical protein